MPSELSSYDTESADQIVARHVGSDEKILWAGRPNVDVMRKHGAPKSGGGTRMLVLFVFIASAVFLASQVSTGLPLPRTTEDVISLLRQNPVPVAAMLGIIVLGFIVRARGWDPAASHARWAQTLVYAITDRRILIIEDGRVGWELGPEDFGEPRIRDRGEGYADIEFQGTSQSIQARGKDRRSIAFKALSNAAEIKHKIDAWRSGIREREEAEVAGFVDSRARPSAPGTEGVTVVRNPNFGLTVSVPDTWKVEVRKRRKPYGKVFLDLEKWKRPEELSDWNVIKAEGDFHTSIEINIDHVRKMLVPYQKARNSTLANSIAGKVIETDEALRWGRFEGYSVTRDHVVVESGQTKSDKNRPAVNRYIMLHDGQVQVGVNMVWPDDSEPLQQAVHKIFESMELG
jgi:hypothetical protein